MKNGTSIALMTVCGLALGERKKPIHGTAPLTGLSADINDMLNKFACDAAFKQFSFGLCPAF
jgi:hypothetical protein